MTGVVRPIGTGWVVTGGVPGPDVDEFADPDQVVAALAGTATDSLLAVQHPHRTRSALAGGLSVVDALPAARSELNRLLRRAYREVTDVVAPYLVTGADGTAMGLLCLADPAAVDVAGQARVRQAEQVYPQVVAERATVLGGLGVATSAAMLVPVTGGADLTNALRTTVTDRTPTASTVDSRGRRHRLWLLGPGDEQDELIAIAARHPLLVADGNHRVAASTGARSGLLALVTDGPDLRVGAIHRVLTGIGLTLADLTAAWRTSNLDVTEIPVPTTDPAPGTVVAVAHGAAVAVRLPPPRPDEPLPRIDHAVVERLLIGDALHIDPAGPHVHPLPAGTTPATGADAVLHIAPVPYRDVLAVHEQGRRMPRKSTYFTPKPRSGLLLAALS